MKRWWSRRSVRTRVVLSAAVPLAVALVIGTVAVAAVFAHGRVGELDRQTRAESDVLTGLVASGQRPSVLPLPLDSVLLAQVLDADGTVLSASPSASRVQPLAGAADRAGVRTDERGSYAGAPLRVRTVVSTVDGHRYVVVVAAPLGDVRRAVHALLVVLVLVVPLLLLATTTVIWSVAGRALQPVESLRLATVALLRRPTGDVELLAVPPSDDEIARLGHTFNELLSAMGHLLATQKAFVADAAHELRSPLTSLLVHLEVAAAHPGAVDLPELLADLQAEAGRLSALTEDLLLLARLDDAPPVAGPIDLRLVLGLEGPPLRVIGEAAALKRLMDNVTGNARRYAQDVRLTVSETADHVLVDVDDDGPGIPAADRERVFGRWVRLDGARARGDGGSGLGLSLAREIARAHGGELIVQDSPLGGARLHLTLPRA